MAFSLLTEGYGDYAPEGYIITTEGLMWRNTYIGETIELVSKVTLEILYNSPVCDELELESKIADKIFLTARSDLF